MSRAGDRVSRDVSAGLPGTLRRGARDGDAGRYSEAQEGIHPSAYDEELKDRPETDTSRRLRGPPSARDPAQPQAKSAWIAFDMTMAHKNYLADRRQFFNPCVADGVKLFDLPEPAREFHGIALDGRPQSVTELVVTMHRLFTFQSRQLGLCGFSHRISPGSPPDMLSFPPPLCSTSPTVPLNRSRGVSHMVCAGTGLDKPLGRVIPDPWHPRGRE